MFTAICWFINKFSWQILPIKYNIDLLKNQPVKVEKLYDEDMNLIEVARHPDNIYYLEVDCDFSIEEYAMLKIVRRLKDEKEFL